MRQILFIALLTIATGCSVVDDANKTRKTTEEMKDTVSQTNETTKGLKEKTDHLAKRTDDMERELVTKDTYYMLTYNLDYLFNRFPKSKDESALNLEPDMVGFAGAAVLSMPFQFWKGDFNEDFAFLDWRFEMTLQALLTQSLKHIPRDFDVQVFNPDFSYKAMAALGTQLDKMQPSYEQAVKNKKIGPFSLYDVMMLALKNRDLPERPEIIPKSIAFLLQFKREVEYIIQLRHNYLPMLVLCRMTDYQDKGKLARLINLFREEKVDIGVEDDSVSAARVNVEQLKEWTRWLNQALETRESLRAMGIEPRYNLSFLRTLRKLDFDQERISSLSKETASPRQLLLQEFAKAYAEVINPVEDRVPEGWVGF